MANLLINNHLENSNIKNKNDFINTVREYAQLIILLSLDKSGFNKLATFYGGTCLRIFHNLLRFSEDLDFEAKILINNEVFFNHLNKAKEMLEKFGFTTEVFIKEKNVDTSTISGYIDIDLFKIQHDEKINIIEGEKLSIKVEIENRIFDNAIIESNIIPLPIFGETSCYNLSTLFAGKICAVLYRSWGSRVKGRDYFDLYYYLINKVDINIEYLNSKLIGYKKIDSPLSKEDIKNKLIEKISNINIEQAKQDVSSFVNDDLYLENLNKDALIKLINLL